MAKKKTQTRTRKKQLEDTVQRSAFWPLAGAILMVILAIFLLLGGFGTGGKLPQSMFAAAYWALGWAAYLSPLALCYWGILKFTSEDWQIPLSKLVGMLGLLLFSSAWAQVSFVSESTYQTTGGHGGAIGQTIGNVILGVLDKIPAAILFFVLAWLMFFFAFGISPKVILKIGQLFAGNKGEDTDLDDLKQQATSSGFKLKEGVPVEHHSGRDTPRATHKTTSLDSQEALTTMSDPDWKFPSINLLDQRQDKADVGDIEKNAETIKDTFANFNIDVQMEGANVGPRVTQFTLKPPAGVKLTKIAALDNNLALDLAAESIRIEAPIPGQRAVGIEVPNVTPATVRVSSILTSPSWQKISGPLGVAIGKDISGLPIVAELNRMPHLLVSGQTNSGKSVMINSLLISLLYRNSPSDLKLILIDPKHVELNIYDEIPHLLAPVITEPEKCVSALKWAVAEMERRYQAMADERKRNITEYNQAKKEEGMPYIVIVIDELADLMMRAPREVEALIARIAQKARAVGIHLVVATQSPRATVITGLIKGNIPARVAFTVSQEVESRIILDQSGAEKLLGAGDMLFVTASMSKPIRVQGALITTEEIRSVTDFLRMQRPPQYDDDVISQPVQLGKRGGVVAEIDPTDEPIFQDSVRVVVESGKASTSLLQRKLRIGYSKAARIMEVMEEQGIIGPPDGSRPREVLVSSVDEVFNNHDTIHSPHEDYEEDQDSAPE